MCLETEGERDFGILANLLNKTVGESCLFFLWMSDNCEIPRDTQLFARSDISPQTVVKDEANQWKLDLTFQLYHYSHVSDSFSSVARRHPITSYKSRDKNARNVKRVRAGRTYRFLSLYQRQEKSMGSCNQYSWNDLNALYTNHFPSVQWKYFSSQTLP